MRIKKEFHGNIIRLNRRTKTNQVVMDLSIKREHTGEAVVVGFVLNLQLQLLHSVVLRQVKNNIPVYKIDKKHFYTQNRSQFTSRVHVEKVGSPKVTYESSGCSTKPVLSHNRVS